MSDLWLLIFLARGVIATSGDPMTLVECEYRASAMPPEHTQMVCINAGDPACRIYMTGHAEQSAQCRRRALMRMKKD